MSRFPSHTARDAALVRMADILDRAAEQENVSPTEFRAEIAKAISHVRKAHSEAVPADLPAEAFLLSAVMELF